MPTLRFALFGTELRYPDPLAMHVESPAPALRGPGGRLLSVRLLAEAIEIFAGCLMIAAGVSREVRLPHPMAG